MSKLLEQGMTQIMRHDPTDDLPIIGHVRKALKISTGLIILGAAAMEMVVDAFQATNEVKLKPTVKSNVTVTLPPSKVRRTPVTSNVRNPAPGVKIKRG